MPDGVLDGVTLQADGKMSSHDAKMVRLRLRKRIKANSAELADLIAELVKLQNDMANVSAIEFFLEDVE
jgi:hypothetical protein